MTVANPSDPEGSGGTPAEPSASEKAPKQGRTPTQGSGRGRRKAAETPPVQPSGGGNAGGGDGRTTGGLDEFEVPQDPTPFPLLVGNVDLADGTVTRRGLDDGFSAGAVVENAIRDILGFRARRA